MEFEKEKVFNILFEQLIGVTSFGSPERVWMAIDLLYSRWTELLFASMHQARDDMTYIGRRYHDW